MGINVNKNLLTRICLLWFILLSWAFKTDNYPPKICHSLFAVSMCADGETSEQEINLFTRSSLPSSSIDEIEHIGKSAIVGEVEAMNCTNPIASVYAIQSSCTNGTPNNDGYLQLSAVTDGDRVNWSLGNTYTGDVNYANATAIGALPFQFNTGLNNPSGAQDYTVRVFNGASDCFTDVVVTMNEQDCLVGCNCIEYVYLNEPTTDGAVHKFRINADSTFTEVGSPWFDNAIAMEGLTSPHGLGVDADGFVYIGESAGGGEIRKFDCDGNIFPESEFAISNGGQTNIVSADGYLYSNDWVSNEWNKYDICTQQLMGTVTNCHGTQRNWGLYYDDNTETFYATSSFRTNAEQSYLYVFTDADFDTNPNTCITGIPLPYPADHKVSGVTTDAAGFIYIVIQDNGADNGSFIAKYSPAPDYNSLGTSTIDLVQDGTGYNRAIGIIYSETTNLLYVSTTSAVDDCISTFDTDLNYLGVTVPSPGTGEAGKGIAITEECCPTNNNMTIDTVLCAAAVNDQLFLGELINCDSPICEGLWQEGVGNSGLTYDACENLVIIDAFNACGTFTLESDGTGANAQCGAFKIEVNISVSPSPAAKVFAIQPSCNNDGSINADGYLQLSEITDGDRVNWSVGSTYTGDPDYANAIDVSSASFPYIITSGLGNPSGSQDYTVRVFNDIGCLEGCGFTDYTVTMNEQDCTVGCECTEYVYLNEPTTDGAVHKFIVNADSTFTEIGNPWFDNAVAMEGLIQPHGVAVDLNGFVYIGERHTADQIRKFTCDGEIFPESEFVIDNGGQTNIVTVDGRYLYANDWSTNTWKKHDICTQELLGTMTACHSNRRNWGLYYDENTATFYATSGFFANEDAYLHVFTDADFHSGNCNPGISLPYPTNYRIGGITTDTSGFIYIVIRDNGSGGNYIAKHSSVAPYTQLSISAIDNTEDSLGYNKALGIIHSETTNLLYVSTVSAIDDCVSTFDTDLNYIGTTVPSPGTGDNGKGIALTKECCPTSNNQVVDTALCAASVGDILFLAELINCEGAICEGLWQADSGNIGVLFDPCNNSITIDSTIACGKFILESDGTGAYSQCGAFKIEVNISVSPSPAAKVFAIQPSCNNDGSINADGYLQLSEITDGDRVNWSVGSTYTGDPDYANAIDVSSASFPYIITSGLGNPSGSQDYTVRVFNDIGCLEGCGFTDYTVTMNEQDCTMGCDCEEYIYLNDVSIDAVHKFQVASDGALTEIGSPWIPNGTINNPHGLAIDLNGNLVIGQADNFNNNVPNGPIYKLDCDGNILETDILNPVVEYGYNFFSKDGILYTFDNNSREVKAYDLCDGSYIGAMNFVTSAPFGVNWGMYIDDTHWYLSDYGNDRIITGLLDISLFSDPAINSGSVLFSLDAANDRPLGVTRDVNGNFFVVDGNPGNPQEISIFKYSATGTLITSITDNVYNAPPNTTDGVDGFYGGRGITYSPTANLLYFGSFENCITVFDTNLVQQTALNIGNPEPTAPKGIAVAKECCPTNNNLTVDTTLCAASLNDQLFLQELINCDGSICEGLWQEGMSNTGLTYNPCDNSVTINALGACGTFTLDADGTGNNPQCGAFKITVNIAVENITASTIAGDQTVCDGSDPAAFTVTTAATGSSSINYQWQSSTTDCTADFANIAGATSETYDPPAVSETTYYRVISNVGGNCSSGMCADTSNCVTVTVVDPITANIISQECNDNNTGGIDTDDYFILTVGATSSNAGASNQYEVVHNGEVLATTAYGTNTILEYANAINTQRFVADNTTTYTLITRDVDDNSCAQTLMTTRENSCSVCPPTICLPIQTTIRRGTGNE